MKLKQLHYTFLVYCLNIALQIIKKIKIIDHFSLLKIFFMRINKINNRNYLNILLIKQQQNNIMMKTTSLDLIMMIFKKK